jgi:hypothetical protein
MKHMDAPYKYAESIGYEQFPIILKTYINNTVIKYKSIVMLKMLIQQGFSKDFLFTLCDWSQTSPEFVQIFMGIVFDTLDKINFFFTNCINLGNHHMIKYLLQNNKILAVDIQKNDDFFLAVFKSQSPGRLETLKLLIEHCGGIEKLEISPQRLIRFCEENLNFESDQLKEYLQTLQKNRYAKKRQITLESDNDEPTALDMLANAAIAEEPPIEVKSTEQMRVEKRTMEEERQKLQQKKAETEAKIRAKFAEEADAEKAEKKVENPFKILREAILEKHAEEKRKAEEQKKARSPIEIKTMIRVETEKPNMIQELLAKTPTLIASFPLPVIDFVPKNTETERALVEIQRKYACIYCDRPLEKSGYYTGRPRTVCETCKNTRRAEARKKRKTIDESESD